MKKDLTKQVIKRYAFIISTAEGYTLVIKKTYEDGHVTIKKYNIHSLSMRRFYRLSNSYSDYSSNKVVNWSWFAAIRLRNWRKKMNTRY